MLQLPPPLRRRLVSLRDALGYTPSTFCFVTGTYRSGTTAAARWLGSQPRATSFSESRILVAADAFAREVQRFRHLRKREARLYRRFRRMLFDHYDERSGYAAGALLVDKEPLGPIAVPDRDYARFVQNIRAVVPAARLVFMVRDPLGTIWSMTQRQYGYSLVGTEPYEFPFEEHVADWCAGADLALALASDPAVYVCPFGRLTGRPTEEARRIGRFLGGGPLYPFEPRPTSVPAFGSAERERILEETQARVEALAAAGITDLESR